MKSRMRTRTYGSVSGRGPQGPSDSILGFMGNESPATHDGYCHQAALRTTPWVSANILRDAVASLIRSRITVPKLGILSKMRNRSIKYS